MQLVRTTWRILLALCCGNRCVGCASADAFELCAACVDELDRMPRPHGAAFADDGVAARLVRIGKHGDWRGAGAVLSALMVARLEAGPFDVVTWVPADRRRRARRGGCLPEAVARRLAGRIGAHPVQLLERDRASRSQRGLDRRERRANVAAAYRLAADARRRIRGCRVLLIDDVRTTGATLDATSTLLRRAGAQVQAIAIVGVETEPLDRASARASVSTAMSRFAEKPHDAVNCSSRQGDSLPIPWPPTTKGSPRT